MKNLINKSLSLVRNVFQFDYVLVLLAASAFRIEEAARLGGRERVDEAYQKLAAVLVESFNRHRIDPFLATNIVMMELYYACSKWKLNLAMIGETVFGGYRSGGEQLNSPLLRSVEGYLRNWEGDNQSVSFPHFVSLAAAHAITAASEDARSEGAGEDTRVYSAWKKDFYSSVAKTLGEKEYWLFAERLGAQLSFWTMSAEYVAESIKDAEHKKLVRINQDSDAVESVLDTAKEALVDAGVEWKDGASFPAVSLN